MKHTTLGIGLLVGGLLAAPAALRAADAAQAPEKKITLQTTCPVMGGAIDKALYVDHDGKRIYVCCQGCVAAVKKDPAITIKSMEAAGVALNAVGEADKAIKPKKPAAGHEEHRR